MKKEEAGGGGVRSKMMEMMMSRRKRKIKLRWMKMGKNTNGKNKVKEKQYYLS